MRKPKDGYNYYSTLRGFAPGSIPRPKGNEVVMLHEFNNRERVELSTGKSIMAWGYITYKEPLSEKDYTDYDLIPE